MQFTAVQEWANRKDRGVVLESVANRAMTVDIAGQTMGVWWCTDEILEKNGLKEVTDPILWKNGVDPTDGGLLSPIIFGETANQRAKNCAYINLRRRFFHPFAFENIRMLSTNVDIIARGEGAWIVDEEGHLLRIEDPNDERYDEDNTGLAWFIDNFRKIRFKETGTQKRNNILKMVYGMTDEELFITKFPVIPIFYRDVMVKGKSKSNSEINELYAKVIKYTRSYENEILSISKHLTLHNIQTTLIQIRKLGQSLIEKKHGHFQKAILGKSPDFGARGVISVPSLNGCDLPSDCLVDVLHSGIPLGYCVSMGYPFMIKWVMEFFEDLFRGQTKLPVFIKDPETGERKQSWVDVDDQTEIFTQKYIDEKMEMYKQTYGAERFEIVKVKGKDGKKYSLFFPGKWYGTKPDDPRANTIANRPLTWTDVFYMAAVETLSDKYVYITRYPLTDYFGTFPSQVSVLSTIRTAPMVVQGKVYPHYPIIDLSLPANKIATQFIDTFSISNLYLDAIGGD